MSRVKFSTTSELLREDTFEAERLMELYALHDYKERQISRLREEEKELQQIIADQKEIISIFGASLDPNSETVGENVPTIEAKESELEITKSHSARNILETNATRTKIPLTDSATNLMDELKQALDNQPIREGSSINLNQHQSHSFAQSRQNYYSVPPISNILSEIEEASDFAAYFKQYPLSLLLLTGFNENNFPTETLLSTLEGFSTQKQTNFFNAFFQDIRRTSKFLDFVLKMMKVGNMFELTTIVETNMPLYYNAKRCCFLKYDSQNEELVFMKEKIKLRFPIKQGIFQRTLSNQTPIESSIEDPDVTPSDRVIFQNNRTVMIIPVLSIRSQFRVEGLLVTFDKFQGFQSSDYLTGSILARVIAQIMPQLKVLENQSQRGSAYRSAVQTYVNLCTSSDLASLVSNISMSFCQYFHCEAVRIFKVIRKKQVYREITRFETLENTYPFSSGIVGSCISNSSSINLTKPQFSENYHTDVDCYDSNSFSSSLLVGIVDDESSITRWAIALYNKKERSSFTPLDEESLVTICHHLYPLLKNAWRDKKLKQTISRSKKQLTQAEALTDVIASLKSPTDINSMLVRMNKFFKENTQFSEISLYQIDKFRRELVNVELNKMEVIPLDSDNPAANCARTGRMIECQSPLDGTRMLFCSVINSSSSVIGVFKLGGAESQPDAKPLSESNINPDKKGSSSLNILNTFRSSLSSSRLLNFSLPEADQKEKDELDDNETLLQMTKMWQKVAGSVLEGSQKHRLYTKKKQLIDHMSVALYDNQFESSFKIWQECQFLVDTFEDLDDASVSIESPMISDMVFANTSELSEKTVQLIKTLQSLNAIDQTIFAPQKAKQVNDEELTVIEDDGRSSPFLTTTAINLVTMDEGSILSNIVSAFNELAVLQFLGITEADATQFVLDLRALHPPNKFRSWRLAVDHFQFTAFLMLNTQFGQVLSDIEMMAILLYMLTLYSDPCAMIEDATPEKITKFTLETSGGFSATSSLFTATAWCDVHVFENLQPEEKMNIWNTVDELEISAQPDSFIGASPAIVLASLARYSYVLRENNVSLQWSQLKSEEEYPDETSSDIQDIRKYQMEYERDVLLIPMMNEAMKIDQQISTLLPRVESNIQAIIESK